MDHLIIQVRDAILARLTNLPTTGAHAYLESEVPRDESVCPYLAIEYQEDNAEPIGLGFPGPENLAPVYLVHIVVKQKGDFERSAFLIRSEVETALLGTPAAKQLGGLVQWIRRVSAQPDRDERFDRPAYKLTLQFQANIRHLESVPDSLALQ